MDIFKKMGYAVFAMAMIALMGDVGMSGQQRSDFGRGQDAQMAVAAISQDRAGEIALEQVKGGTVVSSEYRFKRGRGRYAVLVVDGNARVELKIDAATGQVVSMERENIESVDYPKHWRGQARETQSGIDMAKAREIALAKTGGGTVVEIEKDIKKDGRIVFEIEVVGADRKYEIKLDGQSGAVIEYREKMPKQSRNAEYRG